MATLTPVEHDPFATADAGGEGSGGVRLTPVDHDPFAAPKAKQFGIDWSRPTEEVRAEVAKLGPQDREDALRQWADAYVAKERGTHKADDDSTTWVGPVGWGPNGPAVRGPGIGDTVRNVARGTLLGTFADELNAVTNAGLHKVTGGKHGAPYDESVAYQRATDRAIDEESPVMSTATQLAGGLATGAPVANAVIGTGKTLLSRGARGAGLGAGYGYVAGIGNAEGDFGDRQEAGTQGAAFGATLGAALPVLTSAATYGAGKVVESVAPQVARWRHGPDASAETILAQRMRREGATPLGVADDLAQGKAATQVGRGQSFAEIPETIADTSNSMQRLTGSVYRAGGEAGNLVKGQLDARQRGPQNPYAPKAGEPPGQMAQTMDALDRALGISTSKGAYRTEQQVLKEMKDGADVFYKASRDKSEPFDLQPAFDAMAFKIQQYPPPFASELSRALSLFVNPGHTKANTAMAAITKGLDDLPNVANEAQYKNVMARISQGMSVIQGKDGAAAAARFPVDDIRRFDNAKKALDRMIEKASAEPTMKRELVDFKNALLAQVHAPDASGQPRNLMYQKGRDTYVEGYAQRDALDLGRKALNENSEVTIDQIRGLDEGQKKMVRIGLREAVRNRMASMKPGSDVTQIFQQQRMQEILNELIPGRTRPERFGEYMRRQQRMLATRNKAIGGSETAERGQDDIDFSASVLSQMWNRFKNAPSLKGALIESVGAGLQSALAFRQDVASALAKRLLETDSNRQMAILASIQKRMGPDKFAEFTDQLDRNLYAVTRAGSVQASAQ